MKSQVLLMMLLITTPLMSETRETPPRNVLFLAVDDLNTWLLSNPDRYTGKVIAPNMVGFAQSGANFTNAFTASPKCSPSRTAFISGVAPWRSGIYDNAQDISGSPALQGIQTLPMHFKKHGYYTASFGKITHGYRSNKDWWDRYLPHTRDPVPPGQHKEFSWGPIHIPEEEMGDWKYATAAIEALNQPHDRPFFIACGIFHPHTPWNVPPRYLDMYPLDQIVIPEIAEDDLHDLPQTAIDLIAGARPVEGGTYYKALKKGILKHAIQGYLASTTFADDQIGRVLDALDQSPHRDNTIVVLFSDHGYHLGEKHHFHKGTLWEEATHVIFALRTPEMDKKGFVIQTPVSLLDLYPTLVELTGLPLPEHQLDGFSLAGLLENPDEARPGPVITAYQEHLTVRTRKFRYIRYKDGQEELYDRDKDPKEWNNLATNPEYDAIKKTLRQLLPDESQMSSPMPATKG